MNKMETLEDHKTVINNALRANGPFSHNIISLVISSADKKFGVKAANELIVEFDLASLGWSKKEES